MEKQEFNLSEKAVKEAEKNYPKAFEDNPKEFNLSERKKWHGGHIVFTNKDIKEFIRRLKKIFCEGHEGRKWDGFNIKYVIDKLAGEEFIK